MDLSPKQTEKHKVASSSSSKGENDEQERRHQSWSLENSPNSADSDKKKKTRGKSRDRNSVRKRSSFPAQEKSKSITKSDIKVPFPTNKSKDELVNGNTVVESSQPIGKQQVTKDTAKGDSAQTEQVFRIKPYLPQTFLSISDIPVTRRRSLQTDSSKVNYAKKPEGDGPKQKVDLENKKKQKERNDKETRNGVREITSATNGGDVDSTSSAVPKGDNTPGSKPDHSPSHLKRTRGLLHLEREAQKSEKTPSAIEKEKQVDYYRNPTLLSRLIQFQRYTCALERLEEYPDEASTWLVAKRQESSLQKTGQSHSQSSQVLPLPGSVALKQLPLHIACQQMGLNLHHEQKSTLQELLTQLLLVYPEACQFPDHAGAYAIHFLVQYRAPADLTSLALVAHPESLGMIDPEGRSLRELFHLAWSPTNYSFDESQDSGIIKSSSLYDPSSMYHPSFSGTAMFDRSQVRRWKQIAQLLDFDQSFFEQAKKESESVRLIQTSWKKEQKKVAPEKDGPKLPWALLKEKEINARKMDEMGFGGDVNDTINSVGQSTDSGDGKEISPMAWNLLEQRALWLEQLVFESNERTYDLQRSLDAVASRARRAEETTSQQMTELAVQAQSLRKENEALKKEVDFLRVISGTSLKDKSVAPVGDLISLAVNSSPSLRPTHKRSDYMSEKASSNIETSLHACDIFPILASGGGAEERKKDSSSSTDSKKDRPVRPGRQRQSTSKGDEKRSHSVRSERSGTGKNSLAKRKMSAA